MDFKELDVTIPALSVVKRNAVRLKTFFEINRQWRLFTAIITLMLRFLPFVMAVVVGIAWTAFATTYGVDLTQDSAFYLKTAVSMHYDGDYNTLVTVWPPMYPFLVHLFLYVTPWPAAAASLASGVFLLCALITFALLLYRIKFHPFAACFLMLVLISIKGIWAVYGYAWSENAFGVLLSLHFLFVLLHHQTRSPVYLLLAALTAAMTAMTKYAGMALFVPFFFYLFYCAARQRSLRDRAVQLGSLVIAVLPNALWSIRNHSIDETFTGFRKKGASSLVVNFDALIKVMDKDVPLVIWGLLLFFSVYFLFRLYQHLVKKQQEAHPEVVFEAYLLAFLITFCAGLVHMAATTNINRISSRFLSPVYFVLFLLIAQGMRKMLDIERLKSFRPFAVFAVSAVLAFTAFGNLKDISGHFKRLSQVEKHQDAYLTFGFERSKLAKQLAHYIDGMFEGRREVLVTGHYNMQHQRHHNTYPLFLREALWGEPVDDVVFHNIVPDNVSQSKRYLFQKSELELTYEKNGRRRKLVFKNLKNTGSFQKIMRSVARVMTENQSNDVYFFLTNPVRRRAKFNFDAKFKRGRLPLQMKVLETRKLGNINAYHIVKQ